MRDSRLMVGVLFYGGEGTKPEPKAPKPAPAAAPETAPTPATEPAAEPAPANPKSSASALE